MDNMKTFGRASHLIPLAVAVLAIAAMSSAPVAAQDGYLALAGQNGTVEFLRLTDFTKAFAIDVTPMAYPSLTFLPNSRRLYVFDLFTISLNTVLDFGACSGGVLRPLNVLNPNFVGATGGESKLLIGSIPRAYRPDGENAVYIVDPATDTVTGLLPGSTETGGTLSTDRMSFDPDRNELFVSWDGHQWFRVFDANLNLLRECVGRRRGYGCCCGEDLCPGNERSHGCVGCGDVQSPGSIPSYLDMAASRCALATVTRCTF